MICAALRYLLKTNYCDIFHDKTLAKINHLTLLFSPLPEKLKDYYLEVISCLTQA